MLFSIDRVQHSQKLNRFFLFEFLKVANIQYFISGNQIGSDFFQKLQDSIEPYFWKKIHFLNSIHRNKIEIILIVYQQGADHYIVLRKNGDERAKWTYCIYNFPQMQTWFQALNNIDGNSNSKNLGAARTSDEDVYVNDMIREIHNLDIFYDDNGLELTKALLNGESTKGYDFDLFQYIPSTNEFIIYEFLKRENKHITNLQAHPMRYSWTGKYNDNKQKYISFWKAKQFFSARLFLINYSDNPSEKLSVIEVLDLDENRGFLEEYKYSMSGNVFKGWLKDMNSYNKPHHQYLSDFKCAHYRQDFFKDFKHKKKEYGNEFDE